jgi:ribosomal RNA-processing protein 9
MALTGAKDCCVIRWDLETGKQCANYRGSRQGKFAPDGHSPAGHKGAVHAVALSSDGRYAASGGADGIVYVWDVRSDKLIQPFRGHRDVVSALTFRRGSHQLYSGSFDRTVKVWSIDDMCYVETLYGHQSEVHGIDALSIERALTCGADHTLRLWKIVEDSQLIFQGHVTSVDCVSFLTDEHFVSGCQDGSLSLFSMKKKKPLFTFPSAHTYPLPPVPQSSGSASSAPTAGGSAAPLPHVYHSAEFDFSVTPPWISSLATVRNSDLLATGACDGFVRLWKCDTLASVIKPVFAFPVPGFVNGIKFAQTGRLLVAAVGKEHRLGRWWQLQGPRNGIATMRLPLPTD